MIDSQQAAQILFNHRMATQDQIVACWPEITAEKDIAMVLVEKGILSVQTYHELSAYIATLAAAPHAGPVAESAYHEGLTQTDPSIESNAPLTAAELAPDGPDPEITGWEDENWSAASLEDETPVVRKTTRNEHNLNKAAAYASVPPPGPEIESRPS